MLFPTINFAVFFSVVFPVAWALNRSNRLRKVFLLFVSYLFYGFWSITYLVLLVLLSLVAYSVAFILGRQNDSWKRGALFLLGVSASIGLLIYLKYYNFVAANLMNAAIMLGSTFEPPFVELAIPVAISFITFHVLAYLVDVYKGRLPPSSSVTDVLLYLSFFPHLVAGPIVRPKPFLEQLAVSPSASEIRIGRSILLITGGLFKKVVVANYIGADFVDPIFRAPQEFSGLDLWLGMYGYALQIYCDFSAYTDIAVGIANLLGYEFPKNFNQPYRAVTIQDFWRRWHITLSQWLRDYLYIPLGGNSGGKWRTYVNILITMALGGLWHGASSTFLIWGLMHGAGLVAERGLGITGKGNSHRSFLGNLFGWLFTFHFVCITWVFFRAASLESATDYLSMLVSHCSFSTTISPLVAALFCCGALTQLVPAGAWSFYEGKFERAPLAFQVVGASLALFLIAVAAPVGVPPFIYYQF